MEELKKLFEQGGMTYHFYKHGIIIISPVREMKNEYGGIKICFDGGTVTIYEDKQIMKVRRPSMMITDCEYCYQFLNEYGEPIGYVYKG